jgi:hypothetical protein
LLEILVSCIHVFYAGISNTSYSIETGGKIPRVSSITKNDAMKNANTMEKMDKHLLKWSIQAITVVAISPSPGRSAIKNMQMLHLVYPEKMVQTESDLDFFL